MLIVHDCNRLGLVWLVTDEYHCDKLSSPNPSTEPSPLCHHISSSPSSSSPAGILAQVFGLGFVEMELQPLQLRQVPKTFRILRELLLHAGFAHRALGLARLFSLISTCVSRRELVGPFGLRALVAASRSTRAIFELSLEVLGLERASPGSFTRR